MDSGEETSIVEVETKLKGPSHWTDLEKSYPRKELEPCLTSSESAVSTSIKAAKTTAEGLRTLVRSQKGKEVIQRVMISRQGRPRLRT